MATSQPPGPPVCPKCGLFSPPSAERCDCGYRFTSVTSGPEPAGPSSTTGEALYQPPRQVRYAWITAIVFGVLTLIAGPFVKPGVGQTPQEAVGQVLAFGLTGMLLIVLGLAVRRGHVVAAWILVALAVLDFVTRIVTRHTGWIIPIIALVMFLQGTVALRRAPPPRELREIAWSRVPAELALLQALWTGFMVLWSAMSEPISFYEVVGTVVDRWYLADAALLAALGFAAWRRQVWAAWTLVITQLLSCLVYARNSSLLEMLLPVAFVVIYAIGAYHVGRLHGPMARSGRIAVVSVALAAVVFASWFLSIRPTPYQLAMGELGKRLLEIPELRERFKDLDAAQAKALGAKLALRGALRLSDSQLIQRAQLMGEILQVLDEHNCAEQARGGRGNIEPALQKVRPETLRAWSELAMTAMTAEAQDAPPPSPRPSEDEIDSAVLEVSLLIPEVDRERFERAAGNLNESTDADACWVIRTIVVSVPNVSATNQAVLAKLLVLAE